MKILFIQHQNFLNGQGGTEKICSFLANGFARENHEVTIATNQNIHGKPIFPLDKSIKIDNIFDSSIIQIEEKKWENYHGKNPFKWLSRKVLKKRAKLYNKNLYKKYSGKDNLYQFNLRQRSKQWRTYIDNLNPDLIITMSISTLLEISFENEYKIPIVNSVNGRPDYDYSDILWHRSKIEMKLLKESYKSLSGIQVLFDSYQKYLPNTFSGKVRVIPNPVDQKTNKIILNTKKEEYKIVHLGTINLSCKQQHKAVEIFSEVADEFPNWNLYFWGTGSDSDQLKKLIFSKNLQNRIFVKGFTQEPNKVLENADIFIFPSAYEGFSLALTEAMSLKLPVLGFQYCSGVNELIENGKTGFLAQDQNEMKNQLQELMRNPILRKDLGEKAHESIKKYAPENILKEWKNFINEIVEH